MQKVRSCYVLIYTWAAYKTTIYRISLTVLYAIAYISYLALEKGFPKFKQIYIHFTLKAVLYQISLDIIRISFDLYSWS